jgi:hypothetical protein
MLLTMRRIVMVEEDPDQQPLFFAGFLAETPNAEQRRRISTGLGSSEYVQTVAL